MALDKAAKEQLRQEWLNEKVTDLAKMMVEQKQEIDRLKKAATEMQELYDLLRIEVVPAKMEEMELSSMNIKGLGRLTISADAYVTTVKGQKPSLIQWMKDNGFEELVKEDVNASTLKAWYKEQVSEGNEVPDDDIINFLPFERASVTKA